MYVCALHSVGGILMNEYCIVLASVARWRATIACKSNNENLNMLYQGYHLSPALFICGPLVLACFTNIRRVVVHNV